MICACLSRKEGGGWLGRGSASVMGPWFRLKRGIMVEKPTVKKLCFSSYAYPGPIFISGYCLAISSCNAASAAAYCARERRRSSRLRTALRWISPGERDSALGGVSRFGQEKSTG